MSDDGLPEIVRALDAMTKALETMAVEHSRTVQGIHDILKHMSMMNTEIQGVYVLLKGLMPVLQNIQSRLPEAHQPSGGPPRSAH